MVDHGPPLDFSFAMVSAKPLFGDKPGRKGVPLARRKVPMGDQHGDRHGNRRNHPCGSAAYKIFCRHGFIREFTLQETLPVRFRSLVNNEL
jgi:hypothetical protein